MSTAASAVAWCADCFDEAPPIVNLIDPIISTRGQLLEQFRAHGWRGRVVWAPISVLAGAATAARFVMGLAPLAVWSILRPRRYDAAMASSVLAAMHEHTSVAEPARRSIATPGVSRAYG